MLKLMLNRLSNIFYSLGKYFNPPPALPEKKSTFDPTSKRAKE